MQVDLSIRLGLVAFNLERLPSSIIKFNSTTIAITGRHDLSVLGYETEIIVAMTVDTVQRELLAHVQTQYAVKILSFNLFGLKEVLPNVLDSAGGTSVTVRGEGFPAIADALCNFTDASSRATIVDSNTVVCSVPESAGAGACVTSLVNVRFDGRATTANNVAVTRPLSAKLERLSTDLGPADWKLHERHAHHNIRLRVCECGPSRLPRGGQYRGALPLFLWELT